MAAKTIGSCWLPVSCRYDASAAAPAGLCAASISSSPCRRVRSRRRAEGTRSHSRRAGHSHSRQAGDDRLGRDVADERRPALEDRDRDRGVLELVPSGQRERQRRILRDPSSSHAHRRAAPRPRRGDLGDARGRLRRQPSDHQRHARLGDAGLLERDLRQRVPEVSLVIERDRGDRGDRRRQDVGRVEAAAEADLDDGDIDRGALEDLERDRGRDLEERRRHRQRAARGRARRSTSNTCAVTDSKVAGSIAWPSMATRSSMRSRCGEV